LANCHLIYATGKPVRLQGVLLSTKGATLTVRNCQLSGHVESACSWRYAPGGRCVIENCVSARAGVGFHQYEPDVLDVSLRVRGNTFVGDCMCLHLWSKPNPPEKMATPPIQLDVSRNVAACDETSRKYGVLFLHQYRLKEPFSAAEVESLLPRLVG